jgi:hypothetical protein
LHLFRGEGHVVRQYLGWEWLGERVDRDGEGYRLERGSRSYQRHANCDYGRSQ